MFKRLQKSYQNPRTEDLSKIHKAKYIFKWKCAHAPVSKVVLKIGSENNFLSKKTLFWEQKIFSASAVPTNNP